MTPFALGVRAIAIYNLTRFVNLRVEGIEHLPAHGPALLAARHYHHLFDGAALVAGLPRQPHIFVALDWATTAWQRLVMESACALADWPVALRASSFDGRAPSAFTRAEAARYARRAISLGATLLARGEWLAIFPEGFPTVDPAGSRKASDDAFLPFAAGFHAIVTHAERAGCDPVPIVPVGFRYAARGTLYDVTMRLGEPLFAGAARRDALVAEIEARVRALSA